MYMIDNWIKRKKDAKEKKEDKGSSSSSGLHLRNYEVGHTYGGLKKMTLIIPNNFKSIGLGLWQKVLLASFFDMIHHFK